MPQLYEIDCTDEQVTQLTTAIRAELRLDGRSAKELGEMLPERVSAIKQLRERADQEVREFTAEEEGQWVRANKEFDLISTARTAKMRVETVDAALTTVAEEQHARPGQGDAASRGGTSTALVRGGDGHSLVVPHRARRSKAQPTDAHRALAVQAWVLRGRGRGLTARHRDACELLGVQPSRSHIELHLRAVAPKARADLEARALSTVSGPAGAYAVPEGFMNRFEMAMLAFGGMRQVAEIIRTDGGNPLPWPTVDDTGNEGSIIAENTQVAEQDVALGQMILDAFKFTSKLVRVPVELLEDASFDFDALLAPMLGERISRAQNRYFTTGTGTNQPRGIVTAATVGVTAASATAIAADEVINLVHSVDPSYRAGAKFMGHDNTLLVLRKLKDGQGRYLWMENLQSDIPDRLLNYPFVVNQHMASSVATGNKTLLFGQLSKYKIREVGRLRMRRLVERYADYDQVGFVGFVRADGDLLDAGQHPIKVLAQP